MSAVDVAAPRVCTEEGFRASAYTDSTGHQTIGYGFNVSAGISRYAARALARAQLEELDTALKVYPWYASLDEVRQSVPLDMAFNEGLNRLLTGWPKFIAALTRRDLPSACAELHVEDPTLDNGRYAVLRQLLLTGMGW